LESRRELLHPRPGPRQLDHLTTNLSGIPARHLKRPLYRTASVSPGRINAYTEDRTLPFVAETADQGIVGYVLGNTHLAFFANGPVAWVEELMVAESARRLGIGHQLMGRAEEWARSVGAAYLALATRRAGEFYRAIGYDDSAVFYKKTLG